MRYVSNPFYDIIDLVTPTLKKRQKHLFFGDEVEHIDSLRGDIWRMWLKRGDSNEVMA